MLGYEIGLVFEGYRMRGGGVRAVQYVVMMGDMYGYWGL